jgi:N-acetylneuraminic acid mutarotase
MKTASTSPIPFAKRLSGAGRRTRAWLFLFVMIPFSPSCAQPSPSQVASEFNWSRLPDLPHPTGQAGMFAGVSHGVLLAAGGANFERATPEAEEQKVWHDLIYAHKPGSAGWKLAGRLPQPAAYGVFGSWRGRLVGAGGSDAGRALSTAWIIEWKGGQCVIELLPELPRALDMAAGTIVGDVFYVLGGGDDGEPSRATRSMFSLDLSASPGRRVWLEGSWPESAPARRLAVAGTADGNLYLFGGLTDADSSATAGEAVHLRDAHVFRPDVGWRRLVDLPRGVTGAATPALVLPGGRLAVWGGLDAPWARLRAVMSAFENDLLVYEPALDRWTRVDAGPESKLGLPSRLTAPSVMWEGAGAIIGGETAPRVRTPSNARVEFR